MHRIAIITLIGLFSFSGLAQDKNKPKQPDLPGDLMVDFGFNMWTEDPDNLPTRFWGSNSVGLYYNKYMRISDRISFNPGFGFTFEKYAFEGQHSWFRQDDGTVELDTIANPILFSKNKLVSSYVEIPLELRIYPLKTVGGEGLFIGLGAVAGMRIGAHTKVKYDLVDDTIKEKLYDDFDINQFRYGYQVRFGFKTIHFFYKSYLNDVFGSSPDSSGKNPRAFTIGINFSGF